MAVSGPYARSLDFGYGRGVRLDVQTLYVNGSSVGGSMGVTSVNGDSGPVVVLDYSDVGAAPVSHTHAAADIASGQVAVARGGTGVDASAAANGTVLIGNGTGFTLATLTAGTNITINNTAGGIEIVAAAGGLTNITEAISTSAPNNTVNAVSLIVTGGTTNGDFVLGVKGEGALQADVADGTATGGNKRGRNAVDWQSGKYAARAVATQVASGDNSVISGGEGNTASAAHAVVSGGQFNTAQGQHSTVAGGQANSAGGQYSFVAGYSNSTANTAAIAIGYDNTAATAYSVAIGYQNTVSSNNGGMVFGRSNTVSREYCYVIGQSNTVTGNSGDNYSVVVGSSNTHTAGGDLHHVFGYSNTIGSASNSGSFTVGNNNKVYGPAHYVVGSNITTSAGSGPQYAFGGNHLTRGATVVLGVGLAGWPYAVVLGYSYYLSGTTGVGPTGKVVFTGGGRSTDATQIRLSATHANSKASFIDTSTNLADAGLLHITGKVFAYNESTPSQCKVWTLDFLVYHDSSWSANGPVELGSSTPTVYYEDASASTWGVDVEFGILDGGGFGSTRGLQVRGTGEAGKNIRWAYVLNGSYVTDNVQSI